jgi:hypothetical protein
MKTKNIIICITLKKDEVIDEDEYMNIKKREKHVKKTLEYHKLGKKKRCDNKLGKKTM